MATDWLSRLEKSRRFAPLSHDEERPRPLSIQGGLSGVVLPETVRRNRGWTPQIATDSPAPLRAPRPGDFFRNE
jgi:hypothetical protein